MKKLGRNTLSHLIARLWSIVSVYIFIPLYIRILGETAYGLVSFFATLQTTLNILGLGLTNTLRREFAVGINDSDNLNRKYKLLSSIETIYIFLCIFIVFICSVCSKYVTSKWLNIENLDPIMVTHVISIMGISIALQLLANLYAGCLFGLDKQILANSLTISWSFLKSIGSLLLIMLVDNNLVLFYSWHVFIDMVYLVVLRILLANMLKTKNRDNWEIKDICIVSTVWGYTMGILLISFISLINRQLDKLIISNSLTITELGAYNVATTLGSLSAIVPSSISAAIFPSFTHQATTNDEQLYSQFCKINKYVSIILSCMGSFIAVFSLRIIRLWTGSELYVEVLGIVSFFVVLAIVIIEYQEVPYVLALAHGNPRINVIVGGVFIPIVGLFTFLGIKNYGLLGAGVVYLLMMLMQTTVYLYAIYKKYTNKSPLSLLIQQFFSPLIISLGCAFASKIIIQSVTNYTLTVCVLAVFFGLLTLGLEMILFCRKELLQDFGLN